MIYMTIGPAPMCVFCRHLKKGEDFRCDAFPDGIPSDIIENNADHRKPYPGDHGIRFEIKKDFDPDEVSNSLDIIFAK